MLTPRSGLPALIVGVVLFALLLNTLVMSPDRPRLLRSFAVVTGSAFVLKFVVLASLADPEGGRTKRVLLALFDVATLGTISQAPLHAAAGYFAFATRPAVSHWRHAASIFHVSVLDRAATVWRARPDTNGITMPTRTAHAVSILGLLIALLSPHSAGAQPATRPFGTLREQATMQQEWLKKRFDTFLAPLMRKHGDRHVGHPDAGIRGRPGLQGADRARDLCRAAPDHLRVLRQMRRRRRRTRDRVHRADRARRHLPGRRVRGAPLDEEGGGGRRRGPAGGTLGRRAMAGAEGGDRGTQAPGHRDQSIDGLCLLGRPVER